MSEPTFTSPPDVPVRGSAQFSDQTAAFLTWMATYVGEHSVAVPWYVEQTSTVAADVLAVAGLKADVELLKTQAEDARDTANNISNASLWVSGTTYAIGDTARSAINFKVYIDTVGGASTTDPAEDTARWSYAGAAEVGGVNVTITGNKVASYVDRSPRPPLSVQMGTSWYNETLGTSTRGTRREMPSGLIVDVDTTEVAIRDVDDPSLPLEVGFTVSASKPIRNNHNCAAFASGRLYVGCATSGLVEINFARDTCRRYITTGYLDSGKNIADRNDNISAETTVSTNGIINNAVNAIATYIAPDAPLDEVSGLPIPIVAVGTDGGVSVILEDGTVYDSSATIGVSEIVADEHGVWWSRNGATHTLNFATWADVRAGDGFGDQVAQSVAGVDSFDMLTRGLGLVGSGDQLVLFGETPSADAVPGLMRHFPNYRDQSKGLFQLQTPDYATPLMFGDVKGAWLSEASDADLVAATPLDDDFSGYADQAATEAVWSLGNSNDASETQLDASTGELVVTSGGVADGNGHWAQRSFTTVIGQRYAVQVEFVSESAAVPNFIRVGGASITTAGGILASATNPAVGTTTLYFTATAATSYVAVGHTGASSSTTWDNIRVDLTTPDRSVNGKGLIPVGNIAAAYVNTGAKTVGFSGFSATDYLYQPYSADLDFGTGDFFVSLWVDETGTSGTEFYLERKDRARVGTGFALVAAGSVFEFRVGSNMASTTGRNNGFTQLVGVRRSGVAEFYVNGVLENVTTDTTDLDNASAELFVGVASSIASSASTATLALPTISAGAPTVEQIALKYRMERPRFYGGAVGPTLNELPTDISFDPTTGILWAIGASNVIGYDKYGNQVASTLATKPTNHDSIEANNGHVITWEAS